MMTAQNDARNDATPTSPSHRAASAWAALVASSVRAVPLDECDPAARSCAPWCSQAGADVTGRVAHPVAADPADRCCSTDTATVPLALHRGAESIGSQPAVIPAALEVTLVKGHHEAEPVVELEARWWRDGDDGEDRVVELGPIRLRPAEVMALVGTLVGAHDLAVEGDVR